MLGIASMKMIVASAADEEIKEKVDTRPKVTVAAVHPVDFTVQINSYGEVTPLETTRLAAQVAGEVVDWHPNFIPGGLVKRGDVLFSIEKDSYEAKLLQAEASLNSAKAQLIQEQAQAEVAKQEAKTLPASRVTDLYLRKPQLLSAQAAVKSAEAQLRIAQRDLDNCEVVAPYDALVVSRNIGKGDFVNVGTVAAVLNNIETAEITFPIAGFDRPFIPGDIAGQIATVTLDNVMGTQRQATIMRDTGLIDQATRMTHFVARINDPYSLRTDAPVVKFGSYATISFDGRTLNDVYRLPQELITNNMLWTLNDQNQLQAKKVTVVRQDGSFFLIRGQFDANNVVQTLPEYPQEGMEVRIIDDSSNMVAQQAAMP